MTDSQLHRITVAPTTPVAVVVQDEDVRALTAFKWGLIPSWAKDAKVAAGMINARAESVAEKPAFKNAFRRRRCLMPVDGFYEWDRSGGEKVPYYIHMEDGEPFAFAAIWEENDKIGDPITSCSIITTDANPLMVPIHHRMPVILPPNLYDVWLDADADSDALQALLRPYDGGDLALHPVSKKVNSTRNNDPSLIEPVEEQPPLTLFDAVPDALTPNPK